MPKSVAFFATPEDLQGVLLALEESYDVKYTLAGTFDCPALIEYRSCKDIDGFAVALRGDSNHEAVYLISDRRSPIALREIEQRNGVIRYVVDQMRNAATVAVRPGGVFGQSCIIAGQVGVAAAEESASVWLGCIANELKRRFKKVKSFWVGPEAMRVLEAGGRLTASVKSPAAYDLQR